MRLGISGHIKHADAQEWAAKLRSLGCGAVVFPCGHHDSQERIDAYLRACQEHDLLIAEVGSWCNPMHDDPAERAKSILKCQNQLRLAERVGARCCVNIAGTSGEVWDGGYVENYSEATYRRIVETTREIIDAVKPVRTFYTLEPMPWMVPDSPESYLRLIEDVDRPAFAVHLDVVNMINCPERYFFNAKFIEKCFKLLGPHIKSCHVKDVRLERYLTFNLKEVPCGQGNLDLATYARLADGTNPDMPFIIEHLSTEEEYVAAVRLVRRQPVAWR